MGQRVRALETMLMQLQETVQEERDKFEHYYPGAEEWDDEVAREEEVLSEFRRRLRPGMPVHVNGLKGIAGAPVNGSWILARLRRGAGEVGGGVLRGQVLARRDLPGPLMVSL